METLEILSAAAKDGHVIGMAFVVLMRRGNFVPDSCGELAANPVLARGMVGSLDDHLRDLVAHRPSPHTTI